METDGRLPDGTSVADAAERVDRATGGAADFFMINCARSTHNAALRDLLPLVRLLGGCCGTDHRHVAETISAWGTA